MVPETSAPGAEILPSATVRVELADGSHFGNNCHVPKPVIGRLRHRGNRGNGCGYENGTQKNSTNAIMAHENPIPICVMMRHIQRKCVQNLLRRGIPGR
jgi:hypothetical protein